MIIFTAIIFETMAKKAKEVKEDIGFALNRENYKLMAIGFAVIVVGFILLSGGGSDDPNVFSEDIFNFRRLTIAPIVLFLGFAFEIYAIMKKPNKN